MISLTYVEDAARFDDIYRWATFIDASENGTATKRPYGRVEGIRLYVET
jgi:hypothetical protein